MASRRRAGLVVSVWMIFVVLVAVFGVALNVPLAEGNSGTIYIKADGSIDPSDAPISTLDNVTYTLTGNITSSGDGIIVERDNIIIDGDGYTLQGSGYPFKGIDLTGRSNVTIKNVSITAFYYGIYLYSSSSNSIMGNNITNNNAYGIELESSSGNSVTGNNITNNDDGIGLLSSSNNNSVIENNIADNNWDGIVLGLFSSNNIVSGNNITANGVDGIQLWDYSSHNKISGNNITNNSDGIVLHSSSSNNISRNNITANNEFGIWLYSYSNNNSISGNIIANNHYGIGLSYSSGNSMYGNNITNNSYGFYFNSSPYNRIYHNNIINNTNIVYFYLSSTNDWDNDYPSGGNYWSSYIGVDSDGDGIGDTPYIIDANNRDRYPLMTPWPSGPGLHELEVGLKAPTRLPPGNSTLLEATITNKGFSDEENVTFILLINNTVVNSTVISLLEAESFSTISYFWTPTVEGWFNVTAYAIPVPEEIYVANNLEITFVRIHAATIIRVPYDYLTIQAAVDVAEDEDTVFVYSGTYYENVVVNNGMSLIGENKETTIIDGGGKTVISVVANNVIIANFTVQNGSSGIYLSDSHNVSIYNNRLNNNWVAIWVYYSDIISIRKNTLTNSALAICLDHSNGNLVTENNMMGAGITLSTSCRTNISRNNIDGGERGISLLFVSAYNIISENNITNHVDGICYQYSYWNKFYHNNFINNFFQVDDYGFNDFNDWDDGYPSGGNYWSDYTGIDEKSGPNQDQPGSDGIGDTGGPVGDRYPLMNPWAAPFPVAKFIYTPYYPRVNKAVTFNASSSYDSDGTIKIYTWDFGDGNTTIVADSIITHVYMAKGVYQVSLTVTDNEGLSSSIIKPIAVGMDSTPPSTIHDYDGLWHTADLTITLVATDDFSGVAEIYYRINDGPIQNVTVNGQPLITTDGDNKLEYWSVDNADNEESHHILTGIKLDKATPTIEIPSREPAGDVQPYQPVKVSVNVTDAISQVKNVTLYYSLDNGTTWEDPIPMNYNSSTSLYEATILGQPAGTWVKYKIIAYDYAGNNAALEGTQHYFAYQVVPEFPSFLILPLLILTTLITTILSSKKRKPKSQTPLRQQNSS